MSLAAQDQRQLEHDADAALSVHVLAEFAQAAWKVIEPETELLWSWHHGLICTELELVAWGETRELIICIPPGHMKSILVSVMFPAWLWLHRPGERIISLSNVDGLAIRDGRRHRQIVEDPWYQALVQLVANHGGTEPWGIASDQNAKVLFETTQRGYRHNLGINANVTGARAHGEILDDPYDAKAALLGSPDQVRTRMEAVVTIYDGVLSSRIDPVRGWRVTVMQRLDPAELAGELLRRGVRCVVLPTEYDPDFTIRTPEGDRRISHPDDPRTEAGELLEPGRMGPDEVAQALVDLKPRAYAAQHQQRPRPKAGLLFKERWFGQRYDSDPLVLRRGLDEVNISVDCNFRETKSGSYAVAQVWGRIKKSEFYLLDQYRKRVEYLTFKRAVKDLITKWKPRQVVVEAKALGDALVADLRELCAGMGVAIIEFEPGSKSKYERAEVGSVPAFEGKQVYLPDSELCPWVYDYIDEHTSFPEATDDQVDATSQMLIRWTSAKAMDALERTERQWGFLGE